MVPGAEARKKLLADWRAFNDRPSVRRAAAIAQKAILAGVIGYLLLRLSRVGWLQVLDALPESPWFYLFFAMRYLALPISEMANYEMLWGRNMAPHFFVFVRKRIYNFAVMGYSGEVFLSTWARRALTISNRDILIGVKDNNLLSAFVSNAATVVLVTGLSLSQPLRGALQGLPGAGFLFVIAFASALSLSVGVFLFRRKLTSLGDATLLALLSVHSARQVGMILLHAAMYASALPGAPLEAWFAFIALQLVLSRIPFVPNQELVFMSAALTLSSIVGAPEAAVAGMLLAEAGLSQIVNFGLFFATAGIARTSGLAPAATRSEASAAARNSLGTVP